MSTVLPSNPLLANALKATGGQGQATVQYPDVIVKTTAMFVIAVVSAFIAWLATPVNLQTPVLIGLAIAAVVVAIVASARKSKSASLPILYAVLEGGVVGLLSGFFAEAYGSDIVVTAVLATAVVFATCLGVFMIPAVRNSNQGRKFFMIALLSYLAIAVLSLLSGFLFGVGGGLGLFGMGTIGIALSIGVTLLSAWSLVVDFGNVDNAVKGGYPQEYSWMLSLGLFISTVWLYLNILRLLGMARR